VGWAVAGTDVSVVDGLFEQPAAISARAKAAARHAVLFMNSISFELVRRPA
jgi:hypothetical protein